MPEHKRDKILSETMFIFIPLAHRLGLYSVKSEMENIWLRYKEPEDFKAITERIGGKIGVESDGEGHGSTFWIWIPCEVKAEKENA
jgi:(p)ppGpp synthase/HD superfamily hydrolase